MALNNNKESSIPSIYTLDEIERVTNQPNFNIKLIKGTEKGFIGLENGDFFACPIQTMGISPFPFVETEGYAAQTCVKSGYFRGEEYYLIKVASGGYPHSNSGLMQVYSQRTGNLYWNDRYQLQGRNQYSGSISGRYRLCAGSCQRDVPFYTT